MDLGDVMYCFQTKRKERKKRERTSYLYTALRVLLHPLGPMHGFMHRLPTDHLETLIQV
jgi:hypothetical protein